ncbi:hypothetical protein L6452_28178 [Arctium lappa]|uniref:Uncharacterized protein n=1 Tax=Arctium lappa TaxID=4217 RepID=A0ACB8ZXS3_ARCLA|nr:hypothetical protein L6452_28178 [Arctium lappa]
MHLVVLSLCTVLLFGFRNTFEASLRERRLEIASIFQNQIKIHNFVCLLLHQHNHYYTYFHLNLSLPSFLPSFLLGWTPKLRLFFIFPIFQAP